MAIDVSVIIPTFRRPRQLREAIKSVLSQQGVSVEVIVLDDSPEGSAREAVISLANSRVTYLKTARPSGGRPALVRNEGWRHAQGRFIHFLDDDDLVADGAYTALVMALEVRPEAGVAFGYIEPFGNDPKILRQQQAYFAKAARRARLSWFLRSRQMIVANMLFKPTLLVNSACIIRRECIPPLGGYDPDCEINEDVDFYLRAIRRYGCAFVARVVVHYRTGDFSLMQDCLMHEYRDEGPFQRTYQHIYSKYAEEYGFMEFITLKLLMRTAFRWL